jgi:hypothetical protein
MKFRSKQLLASLAFCALLPWAHAHAQDDARAQNGAGGHESASRTRIGVSAGVQNSVHRFSIVPFSGEFQTMVDNGAVYGLVLAYDFGTRWSVMVEVHALHHGWEATYGDDPRVTLQAQERSMLDIPLLLRAETPFGRIPLYLAAGISLRSQKDEQLRYVVTYTGFTERDGWSTSRRYFDHPVLEFAGVAEVGMDFDVTRDWSLLLSARWQHPFGAQVDEQTFDMRTLAEWRLRMAVLFTL